MHFKDHTLQFNVLIVDEDPAILNLLTHFLEMGHYRVRSASDGNQALQMVLQDCPDTIIVNWQMPGLDGLELCRCVRQLHARKVLPHYSYILVLTTQSYKNPVLEVLEAGADDFIEKDITSLSEFRAEVQARLNAARRIRKLETDLEFAAKYDSLTHLFNRVAFFETARVLWDRSIKNKSPLAAIMMDCDLFKRVNDVYGHLAGDAVLRELAAVVRSFSRTSDVICRYGGEEFCALLPGCNEKAAWDWADRIREQCGTLPIKHSDQEIFITVSFGVAERTETTELIDHLIDHADQALLAAKTWGRNRCVSYTEILADVPGGTINFSKNLLDNVTAGDVMIPFPMSIQPMDSVATVADYFLKTRFETLPITDGEGKLIGIVSETDVISMVGQAEHWIAPVKPLIFPNAASYPVDTPIQKIIDFLNRTSVRRVMIVEKDILVGYICRTPLLRWLRNQWAITSGQHDVIIPGTPSQEMLGSNLSAAIETLKKELAAFDAMKGGEEGNDDQKSSLSDRTRIASTISQCQEAMDQVLRYGSIPTTKDSVVLLPEQKAKESRSD